MHLLPLRTWLVSLLLLTSVAWLSAADKGKKEKEEELTSLDGRTFEVIFPTEKNQPVEQLVFQDGKIAITSLKGVEIICKAVMKRQRAQDPEIIYSGTATDKDGGRVDIEGTVLIDGQVRGSIIVRKKDADPIGRNFNGKQTAGPKAPKPAEPKAGPKKK
jgi:hypothetical protein